LIETVSRNQKAREAIEEVMDLEFEAKELAETRYRAKLMSESEFSSAPEEKEGA
jgi:hypothetical protein